MRKELENIELFDLYNSGKMSPSDSAAFEQKLNANPQMASDFAAYKELMVAYHRSAMSSAIQSHTAATASHLLWKKIGVIAGIATSLVVGYLLLSNYTAPPENLYASEDVTTPIEEVSVIDLTDLPVDTACETPEVLDKTGSGNSKKSTSTDLSQEAPVVFGGLDMWTQPETNSFTLDLKENEVLQGDEGTIVLVEPESFLDENGEIVEGPVKLELAEFLTVDKMILANLTTMSNGTNLETDGMIHLKASKNGKELKINPKKPLQISIPTDELKADMLVFDGEVTNGNINWVDPIEMDKYLVKIDLANLDFLPDDFETELYKGLPYMSRDNVDKAFVDSCYYSLSRANRLYEIADANKNLMPPIRDQSESAKFKYPKKGDTTVESTWYNANLWQKIKSSFTGRYYSRRFEKTIIPEDTLCIGMSNRGYYLLKNNINQFTRLKTGVDPAAVRTIKDEKFKDTWIATREFETRLHHMQKLDNGQELLDTYCQNLDKPMHEIDAQVIPRIGDTDIQDEFKTLLTFKHTTLANSPNAKTLSTFYNKAREENNKEMAKAYQKMGAPGAIAIQLTSKNLNTPATRQAYQFSWSGGSWINIDKYLHLLSKKPSVLLPIYARDSSYHTRVYQYIGFLKNLTSLREQQVASYVGNYPNRSLAQSIGERKGMAISISYQGDNKFRFGMAEFNPYKVDEVTITYEELNPRQLKERLKKLDHSEKYLRNLKQEIVTIKRSVDKNRAEQVKIETDEAQGKTAFKFWKPLALIVYLRESIANKIDKDRE